MFRRLQLYRWKPPRVRAYRVIALDGSTLTYQLETRAKGVELLQLVLKDLEILEGDYFGLLQSENKQWIMRDKTLKKQLRGNEPYLLYMGVEVYPKDHNSLLYPTTRYQIYLQAKKDVESGSLVCSSETGDRLRTIIAAETRCAEMVSSPILDANAELECHLGNTNESSRDSCAREFLEAAQLEDGFGTFVYSDSGHRPFSLRLGPDGLCIVGSTRVDWDSVSKVSSFGRHLTICTMDTMQEIQAPPITVTFSSSSFCSSVVAHCMRFKSSYSDLAYESTKTKLKRLLSWRLARDAIGKQSSHSPQPARLKKTTSFSTRFRSFRNRRTILAGHSMENITQLTPPLNVSLTYQQPTQQRLPKSSSQCISLSLTPPPSPTPSCHVVDVVSSTDSCSKIARSGNCHPTLAACDFVYTSVQPSQLCADVSNVSGLDTTAEYSTHSEIGNLDGLLQTLEQKFKEHTSTILSNLDPHASLVTTSVRKKRSISATDIHGVKVNHTTGHIKNHLSAVELNHFSPPTIMDPHVRSLVFDACENNALGTEL